MQVKLLGRLVIVLNGPLNPQAFGPEGPTELLRYTHHS